jgi:hypothetical protein
MKRRTDILNAANSLNTLIHSSDNVGLLLCMASMADIILNSRTEKRTHSIRYFQGRDLRAIIQTSNGELHGEFKVFYPDGKIWVNGYYRQNKMIFDSLGLFMPNGSLVPKPSMPNNVVPIR